MIITAIIQAIKTFFTAVAKVIAWLLTALGLWVPLLYSLLFLIVIAIAGIPIETTGTAYFLGLFISLGLALWISMIVSAKKSKAKKQKNVDYNVAEAKKKSKKAMADEDITMGITAPANDEKTGGLQAGYASGYIQNQATAPQMQNGYAPQPQQNQPPYPPLYSQPQPTYRQPTTDGFMPYNMPPSPQQQPQNSDTFMPYNNMSMPSQPQPSVAPSQNIAFPSEQGGYPPQQNVGGYSPSQSSEQNMTTGDYSNRGNGCSERAAATYDEKPRIFRLRSNPDMLVYEYGDRLDYYKIDGDYRRFLYSEKKK